jgi:hypothetical protein
MGCTMASDVGPVKDRLASESDPNETIRNHADETLRVRAGTPEADYLTGKSSKSIGEKIDHIDHIHTIYSGTLTVLVTAILIIQLISLSRLVVAPTDVREEVRLQIQIEAAAKVKILQSVEELKSMLNYNRGLIEAHLPPGK